MYGKRFSFIGERGWTKRVILFSRTVSNYTLLLSLILKMAQLTHMVMRTLYEPGQRTLSQPCLSAGGRGGVI